MQSEYNAALPGLLHRLPEPPRKVAVLRASRIGDFLHTYPALRSLRQALPAAEISLITLPMLADLAKRCPSVDRVIHFPGFPGLAEQLFDARQTVEFFQKMVQEGFDLAVQLQGSGVHSNPFVLLLGAAHTAGFIRTGDPLGLLDAALPLPETGRESQRMMALPAFLGAAPVEDRLEFPLWPADRHAADDLLSDCPEPWIGLHTMARDSTRRWPLERFAAAAQRLQSTLGGTVILIGEQFERLTTGNALRQSGVDFLNLAGMTSLPVTGAVIERLAVFVTNDTGPAHIAYALNTPTVTVVGGGDLERYSPPPDCAAVVLAYPVPCRPCALAECPIDNLCLNQISVDQVVTAALELVRAKPSAVSLMRWLAGKEGEKHA
ncbi:MAG TPA: glycosyltransferase family 9 protein [Anaerolineaceae bacterium]|nr:glycosyltransferase family 9 protein [Anaerolineaceae bacterium]